MAHFEYDDIPFDYAACMSVDCPMADRCLHQLVFALQMEKQTYLRVISPKCCTKDEQCKHFMTSEPTKFARGFTNFQEKMLPKQYKAFMKQLIREFGRNSYFKRRSGEKALPPKEQKMIMDVLHDVGIKDAFEFDSYEEAINWYD